VFYGYPYIGVRRTYCASKKKFNAVRRWAFGRAAVTAAAAAAAAAAPPETTVIRPTHRQPTTRLVARPAVAEPIRTTLRTLRRRAG